MTQEIFGANVEELERLAVRMQESADRLAMVEAQLSASPRHVWQGQDAARFFSDLDSALLPRLRAASADIGAAATVLRRQAGEQRTASGVTGGVFGELAGTGRGSHAPGAEGGGAARGDTAESGWLDSLSYADNVFALAQDFAGKGLTALEAFAKSPADKAFFGGLGFVLGGISAGDSLASGEPAAATVDALRMFTSLSKHTAVGALSDVGLDVFEMSVPVTNERQDAVLNYFAKQTWGVTTDQLTLEQAGELSKRYEGPAGPVHMVNDSVMEAVTNPKSLVAVAIGWTGERLADGLWGAYEATRNLVARPAGGGR